MELVSRSALWEFFGPLGELFGPPGGRFWALGGGPNMGRAEHFINFCENVCFNF